MIEDYRTSAVESGFKPRRQTDENWRNDMYGLYTGVAAGYTLLLVMYAFIVVSSDWEKNVAEARARSEVKPPDHDEDGTTVE